MFATMWKQQGKNAWENEERQRKKEMTGIMTKPMRRSMRQEGGPPGFVERTSQQPNPGRVWRRWRVDENENAGSSTAGGRRS